MAQLTNIHIKNYRSIKDSGDIPITKLFALIGKNNTGKSAFLKAIRVLFGDLEIEASDFHKDATAIEITGTIRKWENEKQIDTKVCIVCEKGSDPEYCINDGKKTAKATHSKGLPALLVIPDRRDASEFSTAGQRTTLLKRILSERRKTDAGELERISKLLEDAKRNEAADVSALLTSKFREIAQEQTFEVKIEPDVDVDKSTTHESAFIDNAVPNAPTVEVTDSGTGLQSMYLLALLDVYGDISGRSEDGILIIEEPEVYLHPDYQRRMFRAMRKIASENQVIFSTHSPIMISEIWVTEEAPSVRQVRLEAGETHVEPIEVEQVISELGIRYEDVLNPKLTIFVEGKSDVAFFTRLGIASENLIYIPTENFQAMDYFAYMKIISSAHVSSEFVVIADNDGEGSDGRKEKLRSVVFSKLDGTNQKLAERLATDGSIYVLEKYAIEAYFITEAILNLAFPEIPQEDLRRFAEHYHTVYAEEFTNAHDTTNPRRIADLGRYARPKLVFTRTDKKGDSSLAFETAYNEFWRNDENFIRVRGLILAACEQIETAGTNWFDHVLSHADLTAYPELTNIRDAVLAVARN